MVGVSFPKGDIPVIRQNAIDLLLKWFSESTQARITCGVIFLVLFGILFFRFSGGTGFSVFFILSGLACIGFYFSPGWHLISLPVVVVLIGLNEWLLGKRKMHYMPPIAQVEGGGIKRGLTAPEAAVLLELPIAKVLSLVIFGMLKKGILRQVSADPLTVAVDDAFQLKSDSTAEPTSNSGPSFIAMPGRKKALSCIRYEQPFLFLLQKNPGKAVKDIDFGVPMRQLIAGAAGRMAGFNLRETQDYYRSIIKRAAEQAAAIGDIPQRQDTVDRNFEWILDGRSLSHGVLRVAVSADVDAGHARCRCPALLDKPAVAPPRRAFRARRVLKTWPPRFPAGPKTRWAIWLRPSGPDRWAPANRPADFWTFAARTTLPARYFQALSEASTSGGGGGGLGGGCACACAGCACTAPVRAADGKSNCKTATNGRGFTFYKSCM